MEPKTIIICILFLLLGVLLMNMFEDVCGCKVVEGVDEVTLQTQSSKSDYVVLPKFKEDLANNICPGIKMDENNQRYYLNCSGIAQKLIKRKSTGFPPLYIPDNKGLSLCTEDEINTIYTTLQNPFCKILLCGDYEHNKDSSCNYGSGLSNNLLDNEKNICEISVSDNTKVNIQETCNLQNDKYPNIKTNDYITNITNYLKTNPGNIQGFITVYNDHSTEINNIKQDQLQEFNDAVHNFKT
jgi:hypothetical protein